MSLLTVVIAVAFAAGVCYAFVAVPAQTSLQEELPADVRGRVFGVLNMLVSLASFLPIIIVGPLADAIELVDRHRHLGAHRGRRRRALDPLRASRRDRVGTPGEHRAGRPDDHHDVLVDAQPPGPLRYVDTDASGHRSS